MTDNAQLVPHPVTGEQIDVRKAKTETIAAAVADAAEFRANLDDLVAALDAELVRRLDRRGKWTLRAGAPEDGVQFEIKAPSPAAGTEYYDEDDLEAALDALIEADKIDVEGAAAALRRRVTVTFEPQTRAEFDAIREQAEKDDRAPKVETSRAAVKAGIDALRKIGGDVAETIDQAKRTREQGRRRATVKAIRRTA